MSRQVKLWVVVAAVTLAVVCGVVASSLWSKADDTAEQNATVNSYTYALGGVGRLSEDADHTPSFIWLGVGACSVLVAVAFLATLPEKRDEPEAVTPSA